MARALEKIPWAKVLFVPDKPGVKDISDYVANGGNLQELMSHAKVLNDLPSVKQDRVERKAIFASTHFHDAFIKKHTKPKVVFKGKTTFKGDALTSVKDIPCTDIIDFERKDGRIKAKCPWHSDNDPSLVYYPKENNVYCFACGKYGDVIDLYRALKGVDFKTALKELKKLIL